MTSAQWSRRTAKVAALLLAFGACAPRPSSTSVPAAPGSAATTTEPALNDSVDAPGFRQGHSLVWDDARRTTILIDGSENASTSRLGVLWAWDGREWRRLPGEGPHSRTLSGVAFDSRRGRLVLFGGIGVVTGNRYGDTWEWDGQRWEERFVRGPNTRDHHAVAYDAARSIVVMYGGLDWERAAS